MLAQATQSSLLTTNPRQPLPKPWETHMHMDGKVSQCPLLANGKECQAMDSSKYWWLVAQVTKEGNFMALPAKPFEFAQKQQQKKQK